MQKGFYLTTREPQQRDKPLPTRLNSCWYGVFFFYLPWDRQVLHNDTDNITQQMEELANSKKKIVKRDTNY